MSAQPQPHGNASNAASASGNRNGTADPVVLALPAPEAPEGQEGQRKAGCRPATSGEVRLRGGQQFVVAMACGKTVRDAAREAGITERSAHRRLKNPEVLRCISELRGQAVAEALGKLTAGMSAAADVLIDLLRSKHDWIRLGAARALLEVVPGLRKEGELEVRLLGVEQRLAQALRQAPEEGTWS
jgi:hypothetical protein